MSTDTCQTKKHAIHLYHHVRITNVVGDKTLRQINKDDALLKMIYNVARLFKSCEINDTIKTWCNHL